MSPFRLLLRSGISEVVWLMRCRARLLTRSVTVEARLTWPRASWLAVNWHLPRTVGRCKEKPAGGRGGMSHLCVPSLAIHSFLCSVVIHYQGHFLCQPPWQPPVSVLTRGLHLCDDRDRDGGVSGQGDLCLPKGRLPPIG